MSLPFHAEPPTKRRREQHRLEPYAERDDATEAGNGVQQQEGREDAEGGEGEADISAEGDEEFRLLEAVSAVQDELNTLEEEETQQVLLVHKAFLKRKRPLYEKRQAAISKVPDFWLKVLLAHPVTQPWISDGDQLSLSYLESIAVHKASSGTVTRSASSSPSKEGLPGEEVRGNRESGALGESKVTEKGGGGGVEELDDDDDVGFRVTFTFRENPFFTNKELWKEWEAGDGRQVLFSAIDWKDTEEAREVQSCLAWNLNPAEAEETPSFYSIFCDDVDDYEVGETLRGDITENPLDIYMRHDFDAEAEEQDGMAEAAELGEGEVNEDHEYVLEEEGQEGFNSEAGVDIEDDGGAMGARWDGVDEAVVDEEDGDMEEDDFDGHGDMEYEVDAEGGVGASDSDREKHA